MPLKEFCEQVYAALVRGDDQIVIGSIGPREKFMAVVEGRRGIFGVLAGMMRGLGG